MRLLWVGNAPWNGSGYGEQTALFTSRLRDLGHDVAIAANHGLQGTVQEWEGMRVYPADGDWNNHALETYAKHFGADVVIVLHDAWPMRPDAWGSAPPVAIWAPVDHYPLPPAVLAVLQHERVQPIAMSQFGVAQMETFDLDPLYAPHGIDTSVFRPQPEIREDVRRELGLPVDAFIVGMVAANKGSPEMPRKSFPKAFEAFRRFTQTHDDAWLYVHTQAEPWGGSGINLATLAQVLDLKERLRFPPNAIWYLGLDKRVIANLYAAFDVLLSPSMGEGFGIPVLEAQACGVPVIASDHSAMSELTQAGWLVAGDPWWDPLQQSFFIDPFVSSILNALEAAYEERENQELRNGGVDFAQAYNADLITEMCWKPILSALASPVEVPPLWVPNGAAGRKPRKTGTR